MEMGEFSDETLFGYDEINDLIRESPGKDDFFSRTSSARKFRRSEKTVITFDGQVVPAEEDAQEL